MNTLLKIAAVAALTLGAAQVSAATVETNNWTQENAPANNGSTSNTWSTGGTTASKLGNNSTSLVSDFSTSGDFSYTGSMRSLNDNDNMGIVFGWQDANNHYRLGWEGGGSADYGSSTQQGFWLIRESAGIDTVLFNIPTLFWTGHNTTNVYDFSITRSGDDISFSMMLGATTLASGTVTDNTFLSGKVGVYVESNASEFTNLSVTDPNVVPLPASLPFLMAGMGGLGLLSRRRKA